MWETILVLVLVGACLAYVARHYVKLYRSKEPGCPGCSECSGHPLESGQSACEGTDSGG